MRSTPVSTTSRWPLSTRQLHRVHHAAHGHGAGRAASERDDAEGAAVVAPVLHLDEGAGAGAEPLEEVAGRFAHFHDVGDGDRRGAVEPLPEGRGSASRRCRRRCRPRPCAAKAAGSICAAQPVAMIRACRVVPPCLADRLARLAHGLLRDGAGVHDHRVVVAGGGGERTHALSLERVEAAAEGQDFGGGQVHGRVHGA